MITTCFKRLLAIMMAIFVSVACVLPAFAVLKETTPNDALSVIDNAISDELMNSLLYGADIDASGDINTISPDELVEVIVTLNSEPVLAMNDMTLHTKSADNLIDTLKSEQADVLTRIASEVFAGNVPCVKHSYTAVLNGFSITVPYGSLSAINAVNGVKRACVSNCYTLPESIQSETEQKELEPLPTNPTEYLGDGMLIAIIDTGLQMEHPLFAADVENPKLTYEKLESIVNAGQLQAVQAVPTATAADLYRSVKIPYQFDYAKLDTDASHDGYSYHGTHVAGIAAGNQGVNSKVDPVAPHAQIAVMKVFQYSSSGSEVAYTSDLYAAIEDCAILGVDALNMSLGSDCGFTSYYDDVENFDMALAHCQRAGVAIACAAGNNSSSSTANLLGGFMYTDNPDTSMVSAPSTYYGALSVASTTTGIFPTMSTFSSWGAVSDLTLKPEISGWGTDVYSALPTDSYGNASGTSMATPHIAGGVTVIKQYLRGLYPEMSEYDLQDLAITVMMNTATHVMYSPSYRVLVSPRQQGAGSMNIEAAVSSKGYCTVPDSYRAVIDQFDDIDQTGIYNLRFTAHNMTDDEITYKIDVTTLTESVFEYQDYYNNLINVIGEKPYELDPYVTTEYENDTFTLKSGEARDITVNIMLSRADLNYIKNNFANGIYVEGFIDLIAQDEGNSNLTVPFLGFCGDWTKPAVIDNGYYYETDYTRPSNANTYDNRAYVINRENKAYLGVNPYHEGMDYSEKRNAISPNIDGMYDNLCNIRLSLLRNSPYVKYTVTGISDETGSRQETYLDFDMYYKSKTYYGNYYTGFIYVGYYDEECFRPWYGTDNDGKILPNNTTVTFTATATVDYDLHDSNNVHDTWEFPLTVDIEAPVLSDPRVVYANGRTYLYLSVSDNQFVSDITVADSDFTTAFASYGYAEKDAGATTYTAFDITDYGSTFGLTVSDYVCNRTTYVINTEAIIDNVSATDENTVYMQDFNENVLPVGWETSENGWRVEDGTAKLDMAASEQDVTATLITEPIDIGDYKNEIRLSAKLYALIEAGELTVSVANADTMKWRTMFSIADTAMDSPADTSIVIPYMYQDKTIRLKFSYTGRGAANISADNIALFDTGYVQAPVAGDALDEPAASIDEALNENGGTLEFINDEQYPWIVDNSAGRSCVRSATSGVNSSVTSLTMIKNNLSAGAVLNFEWRVSSENSWDYLRLFVNGEKVEETSGIKEWSTVTVPITEDGNYTFEWKYSKDSSTNVGADCVWIDRVTLTVPIDVTGINVNTDNVKLVRGDYYQLYATTEPYNATMQDITYSSSNETVATVDSLGLIHAHTAGEAIITSSTVNNGFSTNTTVTVSEYAAMPDGYAMIALSATDLWGNNSGYQMLLDADADTYGTIIPENGPLCLTDALSPEVRARFEYSIPENCGTNACSVYSSVVNEQVCVLVPAGTYDFVITNPVFAQRMWVADIGLSRADNYTFEEGHIYVFNVSKTDANHDTVSLDIYEGKTYTPYDMGDVNMDSEVNTGDAVLILRYTVDLVNLTDRQRELADINGNGVVNSGDAVAVLLMVIATK